MYNNLLRIMPPPPDFVKYEEPPLRVEDFYFEIGVLIMFITFVIVLKLIDGNRDRYNN